MRGFKQPGFADRQKAAQQARQSLAEKFRAKPGPDDPEVVKKREEREAIAARREQARLEREAAKGMRKPPWLCPQSPIRSGRIWRCSRKNRTAASASSARSAMVCSL